MGEVEHSQPLTLATAAQPLPAGDSQSLPGDQAVDMFQSGIASIAEQQVRSPEALDPPVPSLQQLIVKEECDPQIARRMVYLHIGMHKTASTYIQNRLRNNLDLLARHNLLYPPQRRDHLDLVQAAKKRDFEPWLRWLKQAEQNQSSLLLSAESFSLILAKLDSSHDKEYAGIWLQRRLHEHGWKLALITFVRDQPSYLNSRYTQLVKRLHTTTSFKQYVRRVGDDRKESESDCDMMRLFGWIFQAPELAHIFIPFGGSLATQNAKSSNKTDPFDQLLGQLPLPLGLDFAAAPPSSANQQPGRQGVRLARKLGRYLKKHNPQLLENPSFRSSAREIIERWAARRQWQDHPFNGLTAELWTEIRNHYAESNARFTRLAWGEHLKWEDIFGAQPHFATAKQDEEIETEELTSLLKKLLRALSEEIKT